MPLSETDNLGQGDSGESDWIRKKKVSREKKGYLNITTKADTARNLITHTMKTENLVNIYVIIIFVPWLSYTSKDNQYNTYVP